MRRSRRGSRTAATCECRCSCRRCPVDARRQTRARRRPPRHRGRPRMRSRRHARARTSDCRQPGSSRPMVATRVEDPAGIVEFTKVDEAADLDAGPLLGPAAVPARPRRPGTGAGRPAADRAAARPSVRGEPGLCEGVLRQVGPRSARSSCSTAATPATLGKHFGYRRLIKQIVRGLRLIAASGRPPEAAGRDRRGDPGEVPPRRQQPRRGRRRGRGLRSRPAGNPAFFLMPLYSSQYQWETLGIGPSFAPRQEAGDVADREVPAAGGPSAAADRRQVRRPADDGALWPRRPTASSRSAPVPARAGC